ncbi:MAG TPA: LuxR C-terminal-related transcriptional regulator [Streptosporangiaceae bacterium]|nr:LuxR C-terminal-related transcriptional regulator [Streptosporangiaceae bacterium]
MEAARLAAAGVTAREAEVLAAIGGRLTNQEIAERLFISVRTVESHVSALLRKLALGGRPDLIRLAQQLAADPVLPLPPTSFVGREQDLAQLRDLLVTSPLTCLTGPAGCGKTRLALEAAREWPGETRIAQLGSAAGADVSAIIGAALGLSYEAEDVATAAQVALAGRSLLLVADDCDQVTVAAAEQVTALVRAVPGLRVLATSRQPLGISEERILPVAPLDCPVGSDPAAVQSSEAGRLFVDRARAVSPQFRVDDDSAGPVASICRRLDGLPLAIELAATRVRTLDLATLAESLSNHLRLLERPTGAGRHRSLAAAIEWSWQLLDSGERDLLGRLAALPGDFTLAMAQAVAPGDIDASLLRLADRSLISTTLTVGQPARFRLLDIIRAYAAEQASEVTEQVLRDHARYCAKLASAEVQARRQPSPTRPAPFDEPNYLAALTWAAATEPGLADDLLCRLAQLIEMQPSRRGIEAIRALATSADWSSQALALVSCAITYLDLDTAGQLAARSSAAAVSDRDLAYAGLAAGYVHAYRRQEEAALARLDQVIAYAQAAAEPWLEASAWQARGLARERTEDAFHDWQQAVVLFATAGDMMHASNARYMLARRALEAGERMDEVPGWLRECEAYAASYGYRHELAHIHQVQAVYERRQGRLDAARELLDSTLPVFRQAGDFRCTTRTLLELAEHHLRDDSRAAVDLLLQGLGMAMLAGSESLRAQVLATLITTAAEAGDLPLAARAYGALDALHPPAQASPAGTRPAVPADLVSSLQTTACAAYAEEGRAGGIRLITTLYPR